MQRSLSRMTASGLEVWMGYWSLDRDAAAQRLGMTPRGIYALERGDRPISEQLSLFLHALDELWAIKSGRAGAFRQTREAAE